MSKKLNHERTKLLLEHAITRANSVQEVADSIGVPAPRIAEGRKGKWRLREDLADVLIEKYGLPKAIPGDYFSAILVQGISDYVVNSDLVDEQLAILASKFNSKLFISEFCSWFELVESQNDEVSERESLCRALNKFFYLPEYREWCEMSHPKLCQWTDHIGNILTDELLTLALQKAGLAFVDIRGDYERIGAERVVTLYLIFQYINSYQRIVGQAIDSDARAGWALPAKFEIGKPVPNAPSPRLREIVVTGSCIWHKKYTMNLPKFYTGLFDYSEFRPNSFSGNRQYIESKCSLLPFKPYIFRSSEVRLYLSPSMNYHLVLTTWEHDDHKAPAMSFAVNSIAATEVLSKMQEVLQWLGDDGESEQGSLKKSIAKGGGYIPEVIYFE